MSFPATDSNPHLRLRVFAGPNGSGKSTVIKFVSNYKVNGKLIDFGVYVNADDIAKRLRDQTFTFDDYNITTSNKEFTAIVLASGLIGCEFDESRFKRSFILRSGTIKLKDKTADERLAQIIADFLRKKLLAEERKFSFETVFSHPSKLEIMRNAVENGYKVYLYFVSTESPEINKYRVLERTRKGGHDVPSHKIESRYYRSLELLFEASKLAYQAFFFDNSEDGTQSKMFAHFKNIDGKKKWNKISNKNTPNWFKKYYPLK